MGHDRHEMQVVTDDDTPQMQTIVLNEAEQQNFNEDMEANMTTRNPFVRIYMTCVWLAATGVMILFIYNIATQYTQGMSQPSSSISITPATILPVPKVVVCNWNQDGSTTNSTPSHNCDECLITLTSCVNFNITDPVAADCSKDWVHTPIQTDAGLFDCWTYNGNFSTAMWSESTGYSGSIATVWEVALLPSTIPPTNRAGAQVSYMILDDTPTSPVVIYNEIRYAAVGFDSFYALTFVNTLHTEDNPGNNPANSSRYDTVSSTVSLNTPNNDTFGYIGVSFAFQTLSQEVDLFFTGYTLQNFWGDFAGMIGTLMGLDVIKVASGIPKAVVAYRLRSINPIEDHFNG